MRKILLFVFLLIIVSGLGLFLWLHNISSKVFLNSNTTSQHALQQTLTKGVPSNIVLLGYGGGNHDGAYLTDSIIVAHIDPQQKQILLLSIPRDLWVQIPTNGKATQNGKINSAYAIGLDDSEYPNKQSQFKGEAGGGNLAKYMLQQVTGLKIDNFVGMDFQGFTKTIDTLGGVDVNVQTSFDDYSYPVEGKEDDLCNVTPDGVASFSAQIATGSAQEWDVFPCRFEHIHFDKGQQEMNGTTALKYVRSRHSLQDGTDFGRSNRQKNLILAVKQKIFSIGFIPQIIPFISSLKDDVRTDMSIDDVKELISHSDDLKNYTIKNLALTDQNYLENTVAKDGEATLVPRAGKFNYSQIKNWIASYTTPNVYLSTPVVQVLNGTHTSGIAQTATDDLQQKHFLVATPDTADEPVTKTTITILNPKVDPNIIKTLQNEFHTTIVKKQASEDTSKDVIVTLGNDYVANLNVKTKTISAK